MKIIKPLFMLFFVFILFSSCEQAVVENEVGIVKVTVNSNVGVIDESHKVFLFFYDHVPAVSGELTYMALKYATAGGQVVAFSSDSYIPEVYVSYFHDLNGNSALDSGEGYAVTSTPAELNVGETKNIEITVE